MNGLLTREPRLTVREASSVLDSCGEVQLLQESSWGNLLSLEKEHLQGLLGGQAIAARQLCSPQMPPDASPCTLKHRLPE